MPEGPELESARRLVEREALNSPIVKVVANDDQKIFDGKTPEEVQALFLGRTITAAKRKAKYLWLELTGPGALPVIHFGMTGAIVVKGVASAKYRSGTVDPSEQWPPKFTKLVLVFESGAELAFEDARRFGRIVFRQDPLNEEPLSKLGFDVIDALPERDDFTQRLAAYQKPGSALRIKALLLDQAFTAGVGNWVADEVLYQARIHPEQPVADMTEFQVHALHQALKDVVQAAVEVDADSDRFPADWLFHARWTNKKASSINGHAIDFLTVGSRTSAFVPALQKVIAGTGLSKQQPEKKKKLAGGGGRKRKPRAEEGEQEEAAGQSPEGAAGGDAGAGGDDAAEPAAAAGGGRGGGGTAKKRGKSAAAGGKRGADEGGEEQAGGGRKERKAAAAKRPTKRSKAAAGGDDGGEGNGAGASDAAVVSEEKKEEEAPEGAEGEEEPKEEEQEAPAAKARGKRAPKGGKPEAQAKRSRKSKD